MKRPGLHLDDRAEYYIANYCDEVTDWIAKRR
jgi:hypothetical protein